MGRVELYRKRLIPDQLIHLKDDEILYQDDNIIVTKWRTLRPKDTFDHGTSCYFLGIGIKLSKFYRSDGSLLYWYCDIVDYDYDENSNRLTVTDLLADVIVHPDGRLEVLDLDELAEAARKDILDKNMTCTALERLDFLLKFIYSGDFESMKDKLERLER